MIGARSFAVTLITATSAVVIVGSSFAQQLYRWTDEKGAVHITDTPPPPSAKGVQKPRATSGPGTPQQPYELAQAMKEFPVTLYTAPSCKDACAMAREGLNRRGVPFREIQVWDKNSVQELVKVAGSNQVPVLLVGRSVQKGFEQGAFDALLDSARYPRTGILAARNQAAPKPPEEYQTPEQRQAQQTPAKPAEEPAPAGPYAPRAPK